MKAANSTYCHIFSQKDLESSLLFSMVLVGEFFEAVRAQGRVLFCPFTISSINGQRKQDKLEKNTNKLIFAYEKLTNHERTIFLNFVHHRHNSKSAFDPISVGAFSFSDGLDGPCYLSRMLFEYLWKYSVQHIQNYSLV